MNRESPTNIIYVDYRNSLLIDLQTNTPYCPEKFQSIEEAQDYLYANHCRVIIIYRQEKGEGR